MRVSVSKNFRNERRIGFRFCRIKNFTVDEDFRNRTVRASFQQTRTNLCSTSGDAQAIPGRRVGLRRSTGRRRRSIAGLSALLGECGQILLTRLPRLGGMYAGRGLN
jgi:hypothetical protein